MSSYLTIWIKEILSENKNVKTDTRRKRNLKRLIIVKEIDIAVKDIPNLTLNKEACSKWFYC